MLEFNKEFLKEINACKWLKNCGNYEDLAFDFPVQIAKNKKNAIKSIRSVDWENTCLERRGNFTVFLHLNHNKEYRNFWNLTTKKVREQYLPDLVEKLSISCEQLDLPEAVLTDIRFNMITQFMLNFYSDFGYDDPFWKQMFEIYMAGYLPCGWTGNSESGEFIIY